MAATRSHAARPEGRKELVPGTSETATRWTCADSSAVAAPERGAHAASGAQGGGRDLAGVDLGALDLGALDLQDLPDVSGLLAAMLADRVPLALIVDLANPQGPDSDQIMADERSDVG